MNVEQSRRFVITGQDPQGRDRTIILFGTAQPPADRWLEPPGLPT
jgi:hypothetical protein